MADNTDNTSFSVKEKYSYAYVDGKYAKIAVNAGGAATLADPLTWSYAETHSYVEVDPSSIGVSVPSGVSKVFAKVIYTVGAGGSGGGSSDDHQAYVTKDELSAALAGVDVVIPANVATTGYVLEQMATITVPASVSELTNDLGFATSTYVDEAIATIEIPQAPSALSQLVNDTEFLTSSEVSNAIVTVVSELPQAAIPSSISELTDDIGLATVQGLNDAISAIYIPANVSELNNDAEYVPRSVIDDLSIQFSNRLLAIEASIPSTTTTLGSRSEGERDMMQNVQLVNRMDETEVIDYGNRA